ncbi:hypothetical protein ACOZ4Y_05500 [Komagataeibacter rhaeticus]|uniref:hypothetical protein n=1 Tax=Komagataeibacter rhaeticus TaxID=215221 RepID=UPI000AB991B8|nr:hypothetical protein [Komagataeibacter rhaeticus]
MSASGGSHCCVLMNRACALRVSATRASCSVRGNTTGMAMHSNGSRGRLARRWLIRGHVVPERSGRSHAPAGRR